MYNHSDFLENYIYMQDTVIENIFSAVENLSSFVRAVFMLIFSAFMLGSIHYSLIILAVFLSCFSLWFNLKKSQHEISRELEQKKDNRVIDYIRRVFNSKEYEMDLRIYNYCTMLLNQLKNAHYKKRDLSRKYGRENRSLVCIRRWIFVLFRVYRDSSGRFPVGYLKYQRWRFFDGHQFGMEFEEYHSAGFKCSSSAGEKRGCTGAFSVSQGADRNRVEEDCSKA